MSNKDLFAPPSEDELKMFQAPTAEELVAMQPEETSSLEAAKTGAFSGLSMGFLDELAGVLEAGGQAVGIKGLGAPSVSDVGLQTPKGFDTKALLEAYQKARDVRREQEKKVAEEAPASYFAGQVAGGLATPVPGGGAMTLGKGIKLGAGFGAATALGQSEQDLSTIEGAKETGKEIAAGTLAGGAAGAVIPLLTKTAKGVGSFVKQQELFESAADIMSDAAKGIIHSGDDILNKRADAMVKAGQKVLSEADTAMKAQGEKMREIVDKLNADAIKTGKTINVEPVLEKFKQLNEILDIPSQQQVDFLEDVVNKAAGKGDTADVMRALQKKVAEEQVKKIVKAKKIASQIINLEDEIAKRGTDEGLVTEVEALKTAYKDIMDKLKVSGLEEQYANITKDISSVTPFQSMIEPATNMPVGLIDTDYKTFVKASEKITKYSPEKTPAEIRKMIETLNSDYVVKNIDTKQAIDLRTGIKNDLQNLMFQSAAPTDVKQYSEAAKNFSDMRNLMDKSKLDVIYGLGESGKLGTDERKLFDIIKQFNREGSKEGAFFRQFLDKMKTINPDLATKIETDVAKASRDFKLSSDLYADKAFPEKGLAFFIPSGKSLMMKGAELTGTGIYKTDKVLTGARKAALVLPKKILESISTDSSSAIAQMADKLRGASDKTSIDLYNKLNKILEMDPNKQKAAIFALSQQPAYREMFNYLSNEGE